MIYIQECQPQSQCFLNLSFSLSRFLFSNQLNGTIPPQFGNLTKLLNLYAHNRSFVFDHISQMMNLLDCFQCSHSLIVAIAGSSTRISSTAPSHLSSATSLSSPICTHNCVLFDSFFFLRWSMLNRYSLQSLSVFILSLWFPQRPLLESAQRHHPTSAGQPLEAAIYVRCHRIAVSCNIIWSHPPSIWF